MALATNEKTYFWQDMYKSGRELVEFSTLEETKEFIDEKNLLTESIRNLSKKNNQVICYR